MRRSAWIGAIGTLSKTIFGTLNEDDAVKYDNAIQSLQDNEKRMVSLIKENILVTSSALSKFNDTLHTIKINEARLNEGIDNLSLKLKNISQITDDLNIKSNINSILNSLEAAVLTLSFQLEDIITAIMFSSQNILHPAVLPPTQLYKELVDNYRYLPAELKLPVALELSHMYILMNISSVLCYSLNNKIVFILRIPLVSSKTYSLYHNIALPTPHDSVKPHSFSFIIPSSKYIAITKDKLEYCNLESLNECRVISSREFICDVMTVYPTSANPSCESELLSTVVSALPVQCQTDFIYGHLDIWKPLCNNNWIYVQSQNNKLYIECPMQKSVEINIIGTGIINIPYNCYAYCKSTKLIPKLSNLKINVTITRPDFNIINDSCCTLDKFKKEISSDPRIKLQNIDLDIFTPETKSKLKSISAEADKIINQHQIIKYETHYSILLILITCIILLYCIIKLCLYIKSHNRLPYRFPKFSRSVPVNPPVEQPLNLDPVIPVKINKRQQTPDDMPSPSTRRNI